MFKACLHSILIILILLNGMGYSLIQAHFYLDREQITALYCINKDKPKMECDGKCELGKRLSEAKNHQKNREEVMLEELTLIYVLENHATLSLRPNEPILPEYLIHYGNFWIQELNRDFFHPPQG